MQPMQSKGLGAEHADCGPPPKNHPAVIDWVTAGTCHQFYSLSSSQSQPSTACSPCSTLRASLPQPWPMHAPTNIYNTQLASYSNSRTAGRTGSHTQHLHVHVTVTHTHKTHTKAHTQRTITHKQYMSRT